MGCINQILEFYKGEGHGKRLNDNSIKVWFSNTLRKLMTEELKDENDYIRIKNCLLLLINLFSEVDEPDHYNYKGKCSTDLTAIEREELNNAIRNALSENSN